MKFTLLCSFLFVQVMVSSQSTQGIKSIANGRRSMVDCPIVHELKTDLLFPFFKGMSFIYEFVPARRLGMEASIRYQWGLDGSAYYRNGKDYSKDYVTARNILGILIAARYYLTVKHNGQGWYTGAYYRADYLVSKFKSNRFPYSIKESNFTFYDHGLSTYYSGTSYKRSLRLGVGILAGYKHCFGQHFVLDIFMGTDANLYTLFNNQRYDFYFDIFGLPCVKMGYRF